jgi:glycosyltransferase involved in cell wall biosynthesis
MKKALITDWLEKFGGAEKVVQAISEIYTFDYYYAYIDRMPSEIKKEVFHADKKVQQSSVLKIFGKRFRYLMPFFPYIVKEFNAATKQNKVDLIISSSWALSKGFKNKGAMHICYLQARNFKYIWSESHLYYTGVFRLLSFTKKYLRKFDIESAQNPDVLISNSKFVQEWVKLHYNRDSYLIYPPVEVESFHLSDVREEYYITIGRIEPYKRFDIIIEAFNKNKKKLIVIGSGTQLKSIMKNANENIEFLGFLKKDDFKNMLNKSKGFVYSGI